MTEKDWRRSLLEELLAGEKQMVNKEYTRQIVTCLLRDLNLQITGDGTLVNANEILKASWADLLGGKGYNPKDDKKEE